MYEERFYRDWVTNSSLFRYRLSIRQSDLLVACDRDLRLEAEQALASARDDLERMIARDRRFCEALLPMPMPRGAPPVVRRMVRAAARWHVGPMAAVAGALADVVGARIAADCAHVMVENGGDAFALSPRPVRFALYAGEHSPFTGKVVFDVDATAGAGVCASSGTVGPSHSFGRADAVVAIAATAAEADAAATAIGNRIRAPSDVDRIVAQERSHGLLRGLLACCGDRLGMWGEVRLV